MDRQSQETVLRVRENDSSLRKLIIANRMASEGDTANTAATTGRFASRVGGTFSKLGEGVGDNTTLEELEFDANAGISLALSSRDLFFAGLRRNTSIYSLTLRSVDLRIDALPDIFASVEGLTHIRITSSNNTDHLERWYQRRQQPVPEHPIVPILSGCTHLKRIIIEHSIMDAEVERIVSVVRGHRGLEMLSLRGNSIRQAGCAAIAALLRDPTCNINLLDLSHNAGIRNSDVEVLASAIRQNTKLRQLFLSSDEFNLDEPEITATMVERAFSEVLCNPASLNDTAFSSNHSLSWMPSKLVSDNLSNLLSWNSRSCKREVAIKKILHCHPNIGMDPFFEWDLKVLPLVAAFFNKGRRDNESTVDARKLTAFLEFARAVPLLFVPVAHRSKGKRKGDKSVGDPSDAPRESKLRRSFKHEVEPPPFLAAAPGLPARTNDFRNAASDNESSRFFYNPSVWSLFTTCEGTELSLLLDKICSRKFVNFASSQGMEYPLVDINPHISTDSGIYRAFVEEGIKCASEREQYDVRIAFHGAVEGNIDQILRGGLDSNLRSGQGFCQGKYFAKGPAMPALFCSGDKKILIFAVISTKKDVCDTAVVAKKPQRQLPIGTISYSSLNSFAWKAACRFRAHVAKERVISRIVEGEYDAASFIYKKVCDVSGIPPKEMAEEVAWYARDHIRDAEFCGYLFPNLPPPTSGMAANATAKAGDTTAVEDDE